MGDSPEAALAAYQRAAARQQAAELDVHAASDARALAVLELCESGQSMRQVAAMLGMSAARVQKLAERGRSVRGDGVAGRSAEKHENSAHATEPRPDESGLW